MLRTRTVDVVRAVQFDVDDVVDADAGTVISARSARALRVEEAATTRPSLANRRRPTTVLGEHTADASSGGRVANGLLWKAAAVHRVRAPATCISGDVADGCIRGTPMLLVAYVTGAITTHRGRARALRIREAFGLEASMFHADEASFANMAMVEPDGVAVFRRITANRGVLSFARRDRHQQSKQSKHPTNRHEPSLATVARADYVLQHEVAARPARPLVAHRNAERAPSWGPFAATEQLSGGGGGS